MAFLNEVGVAELRKLIAYLQTTYQDSNVRRLIALAECAANTIEGRRPEYYPNCPRPFALYRQVDHTGYSGKGLVVYGAHFPHSGKAVINWAVPDRPKSLTAFDHLAEVTDVHGHGGDTRLVWLTPPPPPV